MMYYPEYTKLNNKDFPLAPQSADYEYYKVVFEENPYWCYIETIEDDNTKVVGVLSVDTDDPLKAEVSPFPRKSFGLKEDNEEILYSFLKEYTWEPFEDDLEEARYCIDDIY